MLNDDLISSNLGELLGLSGLSDSDRQAYINDIGSVVLESALVRLTARLSSDEVSALNHYLENEPDMETLLNHLFTHHKEFEPILKEEIKAFNEEAKAFLK